MTKKTIDPGTIGGSLAAMQLAKSLSETLDTVFKTTVLRRLHKYQITLKSISTLEAGQRDKLAWIYYDHAKKEAAESDLPLHFFELGISYSLYESVLKTAVRVMLIKAQYEEEYWEQVMMHEGIYDGHG